MKAASPGRPDIVIKNVRIFDGEAMTAADTVLIRGGVIAEVGTGVRASGVTVDGGGGTLLPGLIDSHVHAEPRNLRQALTFGVTTELCMFGAPAVASQMRVLAAARDDVADIKCAGYGAGAPDALRRVYQDLPDLRGPEEAAAFVQARVAEGADYIKIYLEDPSWFGRPGLSAATVRAIVEAAHACGKITIAHTDSAAMSRLFINLGGDALAHVLGNLDLDPVMLFQLTEAEGFVVPTLRVTAIPTDQFAETVATAMRELVSHRRIGPYLDASTHEILSAPETYSAARKFAADGTGVGQRLDFASAMRSTRELHEVGVPVLAGTDVNPGWPAMPNPLMRAMMGHGIALHHELLLLVHCGLSPAQALAAATSVPARCFGLADRGRIAEGLAADLLLVKGDPTADIKATREIVNVWRRGSRFDREACRR
jgi:imidazolonepropionase-like amidohydrolase